MPVRKGNYWHTESAFPKGCWPVKDLFRRLIELQFQGRTKEAGIVALLTHVVNPTRISCVSFGSGYHLKYFHFFLTPCLC
jgi:hypothetical protein